MRGSSINSDIHYFKVPSSELKTLEWDILNPDYLIWVSNVHTFNFLLLKHHYFSDIVEKNQKPVFLILRVPPVSVYNLKWHVKFQINRLLICDSDWLNFIHFSGYKVSLDIKKKRGSSIIFSISTILKFSTLII